ncbi:MAG: hypothetical protein M3Z24_15850, partial [Chloroflexota bacterium]|nr:hypothetical protein [Chloroflexota bacterium]
MLDNTRDSTEPITRPGSHRDIIRERRQQRLQQKQTDILPRLNGTNGKNTERTLAQLREENQRLRTEL